MWTGKKTKKLEQTAAFEMRIADLEKRIAALEKKSEEKYISETTTKAASAAQTMFEEYLFGKKEGTK